MIHPTRNFLLIREAADVTDEGLQQLNARIADAFELELTTYRDKVQELREGGRYTPAGLRDQVMQLAVETSKRLNALEADRLKTMRHLAELHFGEMTAAPNRLKVPAGLSAEDSRQAESEARQQLAKVEPVEREEMYLRAAREGDVQALRTFELAPSLFPLLSAEVIQRGAELYAAHAYPERWSAVQQQKASLAHIDYLVTSAQQQLTELAGAATGVRRQRFDTLNDGPQPIPAASTVGGES